MKSLNLSTCYFLFIWLVLYEVLKIILLIRLQPTILGGVNQPVPMEDPQPSAGCSQGFPSKLVWAGLELLMTALVEGFRIITPCLHT